MKKQTLAIICSVLLVITLVTAGVVSVINEQREMSKEDKDILLARTDGDVINPDVSIYNDGFGSCYWDAYQQGIINTGYNGFNCEDMTEQEIEDVVVDAVLEKLEGYADAIKTRTIYEKIAEGNVDIVEEK